MARHSTQAQQLMQLGGIGQTTAMALISTVGNGHDFACGRSFSAWLGLVPGNTARAASRDWDASPKPETPTCAACW